MSRVNAIKMNHEDHKAFRDPFRVLRVFVFFVVKDTV